MRPLSGQTILVTRPKGQAGELTRLLRRLGARVVPAPTIRIAPPPSHAPLDAALRRLSSFDAAVFTSANGVEAFFARARRVRGTAQLPQRVYAIGPGTAAALRRRGVRVAGIPEVHEGEALARSLGPVRGWRILIPRAQVAREALPRLLRRAGASVRVVPAYRTLPDPEGARRVRRVALDGGADWVTFTSSSTVDHFVSALPAGAAGRFFLRARAASIGPITSAALRRHGVEPAAEARPYTSEGLARAIAAKARSPEPRGLKAALLKALRSAGALALGRFGKVRARYKGRANLVTAADHACEELILRIILRRFPDHAFLTEERPPRAGGSEYTWIIDPIDGTTNYAHRFPVCCVSIAVARRGRPVMGGIYDPFRDELFFARRGKGAFLNGRRIRVSRAARLEESLLLTGFPYDRAERSRFYVEFYRRFMEVSHDVRRSGSAALDLAWTAAGRVEGYWEFNLSPWDVAAGRLLVEEAGGKVTDMRGRPFPDDPAAWGRETLATNGRIHAAMLRILRRQKPKPMETRWVVPNSPMGTHA